MRGIKTGRPEGSYETAASSRFGQMFARETEHVTDPVCTPDRTFFVAGKIQRALGPMRQFH
jgi:hypothetical protein